MDGWRGMLLGDEFPIGKVLPNWAPFPTGLVELGFSWRKRCIITDIMYLYVIYSILQVWELRNRWMVGHIILSRAHQRFMVQVK
jgi:hypothetical protein